MLAVRLVAATAMATSMAMAASTAMTAATATGLRLPRNRCRQHLVGPATNSTSSGCPGVDTLQTKPPSQFQHEFLDARFVQEESGLGFRVWGEFDISEFQRVGMFNLWQVGYFSGPLAFSLTSSSLILPSVLSAVMTYPPQVIRSSYAILR